MVLYTAVVGRHKTGHLTVGRISIVSQIRHYVSPALNISSTSLRYCLTTYNVTFFALSIETEIHTRSRNELHSNLTVRDWCGRIMGFSIGYKVLTIHPTIDEMRVDLTLLKIRTLLLSCNMCPKIHVIRPDGQFCTDPALRYLYLV